MECTYYPDHDQRYAHIHPKDRWKYPDEIKNGMSRYKREKTLAELGGEMEIEVALRLFGNGSREHFEKIAGKPLPDRIKLRGPDLLLLAKDMPYTDACFDGGS